MISFVTWWEGGQKMAIFALHNLWMAPLQSKIQTSTGDLKYSISYLLIRVTRVVAGMLPCDMDDFCCILWEVE